MDSGDGQAEIYTMPLAIKIPRMLKNFALLLSALLTRNNHDLIGTARFETHLGRRENDERFLVNYDEHNIKLWRQLPLVYSPC